MMHASEWTRVVLALLIGTVCAFVAFESLEQTKHSRQKTLWTGLSGVTLGAGVWSTHFFAMLGWHSSFPRYFDLRFVLLSALVVVLASWVALFLCRQRHPNQRLTKLAAAGTFTLGVASMHLTGIAALHLTPRIQWHPAWLATSLLLSACAAYCGMRLLVVSQNRVSGLPLRLFGAGALSGSIVGLHFLAMRAMILQAEVRSVVVSPTVTGPVLARVGLCNVLLLTFGLLVLSYRQSSRWMQMAHDARQEAQEAARQAERLASVGKIVASVAHEINNPLEAGQLDSDSRGYLRQAQSEIARITAITTHTLRFYRQQSAPELTDIPELFVTALTLFEPRLQRAGIKVRQSWAPEIGPILCNAGEMRQVLANLVSNAVDAMPAGGVLTLSTRQVDDEIEIEVRDTGVGISPEVQRQIFEPFFTTKGAHGTGLGLSISSEIVARHEGRLTLSSSTEPGSSGTRFLLTLPVQHTEVQTAFSPLADARHFGIPGTVGAS